jgi:hypothetical protein
MLNLTVLLRIFLDHHKTRIYEFAPGVLVLAEENGLNHIVWDIEQWTLGGGESKLFAMKIHLPVLYSGQGSLRNFLQEILVPKKGNPGLFFSEPRLFPVEQ